jgi:hypothetical protein
MVSFSATDNQNNHISDEGREKEEKSYMKKTNIHTRSR